MNELRMSTGDGLAISFDHPLSGDEYVAAKELATPLIEELAKLLVDYRGTLHVIHRPPVLICDYIPGDS